MLIKLIFVGLALCLVNIFLKKQMGEFVLPVEIIFLSLASYVLIEYFRDTYSVLSEIMQETEYGDEILVSAIKAAGICLITKFSSDICSESGNRLIADVIEFAGRIMLTAIAVPYIESIIRTALAFIK